MLAHDADSTTDASDAGGFFDFLRTTAERYASGGGVDRLNWRYRHIVEPIKAELAGARMLDLGSQDGRWPFAFASAGAEVTGIEGRASSIAQFDRYPEPEIKKRVSLIEGDFVDEMDRLLKDGARFDIVSCLGVYYHTIQHYRMMMQMAGFEPKLIIIDNVFFLAKRPMMVIAKETTSRRGNTISQFGEQEATPIGRITPSALKLMAESVGYTVEWVDWQVPESERRPVSDYFQHPNKKKQRRHTALLRPKGQIASSTYRPAA